MADHKDMLSSRIGALVAEVRGNRKLQYGLLAIAAIIAVELGLNWSDSLSERERRLQDLRAELRQLRAQSRDEAALKAALAALEDQQAAIERRLWTVSSDPVGQARLKDWLTKLAREVGAKEFKLVLAAPKAVAGQRADKGAAFDGGKENAFGLREFRADIGFVFTPEALERMLYAIEGGKTLASVESLSIVSRTRKAEMGVRVIMRLGQSAEALDAASAVARLGEPAGQGPSGDGEAESAVAAETAAAMRPETQPPAVQPQSSPDPVAAAAASRDQPAPTDAARAPADAPSMPSEALPAPANGRPSPATGTSASMPNATLPVMPAEGRPQ